MTQHPHQGSRHRAESHYARLGIMTVLSFIAMYALMYAMVNATDNVFANLNQLYMAGLMTAAMVIIELVVMRHMYHNTRINALMLGASILALFLFWMVTRRQTAISDRQFLRSMIPHHGGAILMCEHARLDEAEIRQLCQRIISGQRAEIDQMKAKLKALTD